MSTGGVALIRQALAPRWPGGAPCRSWPSICAPWREQAGARGHWCGGRWWARLAAICR